MTDEPRTGKAFRGQRGDFRHCQGHLVGPADNSQDLVYFGSFCAKRMNSSKTTQNKTKKSTKPKGFFLTGVAGPTQPPGSLKKSSRL